MEGFNEAVRRLAQYRPFEDGGRPLEAVLGDLVLAATALSDGKFASLDDCRSAFRTLWRLDVEIEELRRVRASLVGAGLVVSEDEPGITLTAEALEEMEHRAVETEELEQLAMTEWEGTVRELRPDLTPEDFHTLTCDLKTWINLIVNHHGAGAAMVLYPEEPRARQLFEEIDDISRHSLPRREGTVGEIRQEALRIFVRQPTPAQRTFLANRMNTAFYLTVLTLDPGAKHLVEEQGRGRRIYLDTNFLYAVLGVAPPAETLAAHRLLQLTTGLGIEVAVTRWTIRELHKSLELAKRDIESLPLRPELATLMERVSGEKGYRREFWKRYRESGTTPKDFFDRLAHFEIDLENLNIQRVDEGVTAVEQNSAAIEEYSILLDRVLSKPKPGLVIEHDVMHRLLVERLRGDGRIRFSNARFWFLTQDTRLPYFAALTPGMEEPASDVPFCISPTAWVQIVRALTPRTEDIEATMVDLIASPYLGYRSFVDQAAVRAVVGRMDVHDDASPELALAVLEDTALVEEVSEAGVEEVREVVERAYSEKAKDLEARAAAAAELAAQEREAREEAEQRKLQAEVELEEERKRRQARDSDLVHERAKAAATAQELTTKLEDLEAQRVEDRRVADERYETEKKARERIEQERTEEKFERAKRRKRLIRRLVAALIALLVIGATVALLLTDTVAGIVPVVALITGASALIAGAGYLAFSRERMNVIIGIISLAIGVGGLVLALLATD